MALFDTFIGLEVHIHLLTDSKVFCSCSGAYGAEANTHVCPVCLGHPGVLPVVNQQALLYSYMVGKALNCRLSERTVFERKNYFYPDMAKNYQISQFTDPIGVNGYFEFLSGGTIKRLRIHDIHLEEDAGKMIHQGDRTLIDYNRAGTSLLEIVTEPDLSSGQEAEEFLAAFRLLVRHLGVCDGNMEEGSLRCDANISINPKGKGLGTKVEIKNLNSSRNVRKAMNYEYKRQLRARKTGSKIIQETRLWDDQKGKTLSMRTKESSHDYRYFPEPDLPPFSPDQEFFREVESRMCALPTERYKRCREEYGLSEEISEYLVSERERIDFFEQTVAQGVDAKLAAKWLKTEVAKLLGRSESTLEGSYLTVERFAYLMKLVSDGSIHANIAKSALEAVIDEDVDPRQVIESLLQSTGDELKAIREAARAVIEQNDSAVGDLREGNQKAFGFLMGQVNKSLGAKADPKLVRDVLNELLGL